MDATTTLFAILLATVALTTPFGLRFDQGGLGGTPFTQRARQMLFAIMALLFGTGFVALAAVGAGALLGIDGIAAMIPLTWLWAPALVLATSAAAGRGFGDPQR